MTRVTQRVLQINEVSRSNYSVLITVKHLEAELLFLFFIRCHHLAVNLVHILSEVYSLQIPVAREVEVKSSGQPFEGVGTPKDRHLGLNAFS